MSSSAGVGAGVAVVALAALAALWRKWKWMQVRRKLMARGSPEGQQASCRASTDAMRVVKLEGARVEGEFSMDGGRAAERNLFVDTILEI